MAQLRSTFLTVLLVCGALLGSACGGGSSGNTLQSDAGPATAGDGDMGEGLDGGSDDQINIEDGATDEDDTATAVELDAGELDAGACAAEQPADECGVCGGHGESCRHPLAGSYAVRTQLYARQKATAGDGTLDLVSKGVVLSVANIDAPGTVQEHYCLLEISNEQGVFSWTTPAAMQAVADTQIALEQQGDKFVRPLAAHHGYFSFSPAAVPANCVPGQLHASGCKCPSASSTLPDDSLDCRVIDVDGDGIPGGKLHVGLAQPEDPADGESVIRLNIAALLNLEWRLGQRSDGRVLGAIGGGLEQVELSREGELSEAFGEIKNAMCPSELGRVELVAGDHTCATVLAARNIEKLDYGLFDLSLDARAPALESCVDPDTICRKTRDECGVCGGSGIPADACDCAGSQRDVCGVCAGPGPLPGTCDCAGTPASIWYADVDGDGLGDPASTQHACTAPVGTSLSLATQTSPARPRRMCAACAAAAASLPEPATARARSRHALVRGRRRRRPGQFRDQCTGLHAAHRLRDECQ